MANGEQAVRAPDISVKKAVGAAWSMTGGRIGFALKKVWLPALLIFALDCLTRGLSDTVPHGVLGIVSSIGELLACLFVAIFFHRLYLLSDLEYRFDKGIYGRFLIMILILNSTSYIWAFLSGVVLQGEETMPGYLLVLMLVIMVLTVVLWCRLAVIFPVTAIGEKRSLGWAWALTKGNGWAVFGGWCLLALLYLPFALLIVGLTVLLGLPLGLGSGFDTGSILIEFLGAFLIVLSAGAAAVFVSDVFRQLVEKKGEMPDETAPIR